MLRHIAVDIGEGLDYAARFAAHVAVRCCLFVDRCAQFELLFDFAWAQVEDFGDFLRDFGIGHRHMSRAEGVDIDRHGAGNADGVGYLHQTAVAHTVGHKVFGDISCSVCG